ncbi:MAG: ATP-binding cassette domain-containing protein [Mycoplasma sp.]
MKATLILINKYFWRGYIGPIFAYIIPLLLILFMGRIIGPSFITPGFLIVPILTILLIFMPQTIFEFKNSSILKRIGSTPVKPYIFLLAIALFNFVIVITAVLFLFGASFGIFFDSLKPGTDLNNLTYIDVVTKGNWGDFLYCLILIIFVTTSIGIFIASVSKSTLFIQSVGIAILLIVFFVGPVALPINIAGTVPVIKELGYAIPLKYPISMSIEAFSTNFGQYSPLNINGSSIWNVFQNYIVYQVDFGGTGDLPPNEYVVFATAEKICNHLMPYVWTMFFSYLASATFSWSTRGKITFRWDTPIVVIKNFISHKKYLASLITIHDNKDIHSENIIEVKSISKKFKAKGKTFIHANQDVSFNIKRGRNLAILGENGAGKTTLIEQIIGINNPDSGNFVYNYDFKRSFQEGIGVQFQESNYPFGIKTKDIISFFLSSYDIKITNDELNLLLNEFGVSKFYNKGCSNLSGGQQQRLNLLLSIIHKPKIVFLDELSTGLDIKIRNSIKKFIKEYAKQNGITIVIISHDMNEVEYLADDIIAMQGGKVMDITTKDAVKRKSISLEEYISQYL